MDTFDLCEEVLEKFREEGIDSESFDLLDDETITKIFPKAGPRLLFKKKFKEYKLARAPLLAKPIFELPASPSYTTSSDTVTEVNSENGLIEIELDDDLKEKFQSNLDNPHSAKRDIDQDTESKTPKKICLGKEIFEGGLEKILESTVDGRIVLMRREKLNNDCRQRLVKEIINYLVSKFEIKGIKGFMLETAADEIIKVCPNEVKDTYIIPYCPKSPTSAKKAAKGKLWSRYVNVRNAIKTAEKALRRETSFKRDEGSGKDEFDDETEELKILNTIIEPKERVLQLWSKTNGQRRRMLRSLSLSVTDYFDKFAALSTSLGPELIEYDFNTRYSDKADLAYSNIVNIANAILAEAQQRKIAVVKESDVDNVVKALLTLPYLFNPVTLKNNRKSGNWRPSRSEIGESFFLHIQKFEDLEETKSRRVKQLVAHALTLQPFGVICGNLNNPCKYLVVIDSTIYTFDSPVRCIEILYKAFHAMDIEYPSECTHLWQFIQEAVFDMKKSTNPAVAALMSDIKKFLE